MKPLKARISNTIAKILDNRHLTMKDHDVFRELGRVASTMTRDESIGFLRKKRLELHIHKED